jgi:hypothetical protein
MALALARLLQHAAKAPAMTVGYGMTAAERNCTMGSHPDLPPGCVGGGVSGWPDWAKQELHYIELHIPVIGLRAADMLEPPSASPAALLVPINIIVMAHPPGGRCRRCCWSATTYSGWCVQGCWASTVGHAHVSVAMVALQ